MKSLTSKKPIAFYLSFLISFFLLTSCSNDDDALIEPQTTENPENGGETENGEGGEETSKSDETAMSNFHFNPFVEGNDALDGFYSHGSIGEESNGIIPITIELAHGTDTKSLNPSIAIPDFASIEPAIGARDFSSPVLYTITAQNGENTSVYEVSISFALNTKKAISSFKFLASENASLNEDVVAVIFDEESNPYTRTKTIVAEVPFGTDITNLKPTMESSFGATLNIEGAQNFTNTVTYVVTSQDGKNISEDYKVIVANPEKKALIDLYFANRQSVSTYAINYNWDIHEPDLSKWRGVYLHDDTGKVRSLLFTAIGISIKELPSSIGSLTELTSLHISNEAEVIGSSLQAIPAEIGTLKNLRILELNTLQLKSIPEEIWELTNLTSLNLNGNEISSVSNKIGNLVNLTQLELKDNKLTSLPNEIENLTNLYRLILSNNELSSIPNSIGDINIISLDLTNNQLTTIPQGICDRKETFPDRVLFDEDVTCQ